VRVGNVDLVGIAIPELEENSPSPIHVDRPEGAQITLQLVQSGTVELPERVKRRGSMLTYPACCGSAK
jgi:hypothetical protein